MTRVEMTERMLREEISNLELGLSAVVGTM
jgi:hypothetical protein